tara:strand:+ start:105 stop:1289 length:1185 start_codon:yes stop_codon:yes gene_type:complete
MHNSSPVESELYNIASRFFPFKIITSIKEISSGNINETYLVKTQTYANQTENIHNYVLQKINIDVFNDLDYLISNMNKLQVHLENKFLAKGLEGLDSKFKNWQLLKYVRLGDSISLFLEHNDNFWRAFNFIQGLQLSSCIENDLIAESLGLGIGFFHSLLLDLPSSEISVIIEDFHNTSKYLDVFDNTINGLDSKNITSPKLDKRINQLLSLIEIYRDRMSCLEIAKSNNEIIERLVHGDPKLSNVLFDKNTLYPISVIDLDTVQPDLINYDIGDLLRSACNLAGEEPSIINDVDFNLDVYKRTLSGYLSIMGNKLTEAEYYYIPSSIMVVTFQLGLRFLLDYFIGNIYFKTQYNSQNLFRAEVQFRLLKSIDQKYSSICSISEQYKEKYFMKN